MYNIMKLFPTHFSSGDEILQGGEDPLPLPWLRAFNSLPLPKRPFCQAFAWRSLPRSKRNQMLTK